MFSHLLARTEKVFGAIFFAVATFLLIADRFLVGTLTLPVETVGSLKLPPPERGLKLFGAGHIDIAASLGRQEIGIYSPTTEILPSGSTSHVNDAGQGSEVVQRLASNHQQHRLCDNAYALRDARELAEHFKGYTPVGGSDAVSVRSRSKLATT